MSDHQGKPCSCRACTSCIMVDNLPRQGHTCRHQKTWRVPVFRAVALPPVLPGRLYLHSMPGRYETWDAFVKAASQHGISTIVCLTPDEEIARQSPAYAEAIRRGTLGYARACSPLPDYGVPRDWEAYAAFVGRIAGLLRAGETVLVHCGAGIGRTGTFAICLLLALGASLLEAREAVRAAGSEPEGEAQKDLTLWCEREFGVA